MAMLIVTPVPVVLAGDASSVYTGGGVAVAGWQDAATQVALLGRQDLSMLRKSSIPLTSSVLFPQFQRLVAGKVHSQAFLVVHRAARVVRSREGSRRELPGEKGLIFRLLGGSSVERQGV